MPSNPLKDIQRDVTVMHGCYCSHVGTSQVHEMMDGKTVWNGVVETFDLDGLLKASQAFAWRRQDEAGEIRYIAVLNVPPMNSPRKAVQAAIISKAQK